MSDYKRLTKQPWSENIDLKEEYGYSHIYKRLYELENQIQNGMLIPKYLIVEDCGFYCVCELDTNSYYVLNQCETRIEADKILNSLVKK